MAATASQSSTVGTACFSSGAAARLGPCRSLRWGTVTWVIRLMQVAAETLKALLAGITSAQQRGPPSAPAAAALMRVLLPLLIQVTPFASQASLPPGSIRNVRQRLPAAGLRGCPTAHARVVPKRQCRLILIISSGVITHRVRLSVQTEAESSLLWRPRLQLLHCIGRNSAVRVRNTELYATPNCAIWVYRL